MSCIWYLCCSQRLARGQCGGAQASRHARVSRRSLRRPLHAHMSSKISSSRLHTASADHQDALSRRMTVAETRLKHRRELVEKAQGELSRYRALKEQHKATALSALEQRKAAQDPEASRGHRHSPSGVDLRVGFWKHRGLSDWKFHRGASGGCPTQFAPKRALRAVSCVSCRSRRRANISGRYEQKQLPTPRTRETRRRRAPNDESGSRRRALR